MFSRDGVNVYAGGYSYQADPTCVDIVLDLSGMVKRQYWTLPARWTCSELFPEIVDLYIPDGETPSVDRRFWEQLWTDLARDTSNNGGSLDVLVMCLAGHGRTGTVLACLGLASGVIDPAADPVQWIRDHYCQSAVETDEQLDYIELTFGVETTCLVWPATHTVSHKSAKNSLSSWQTYFEDSLGW